MQRYYTYRFLLRLNQFWVYLSTSIGFIIIYFLWFALVLFLAFGIVRIK